MSNKYIPLSLLACLLFPSCGCIKNSNVNSIEPNTVCFIDSCVVKALSDSICNIITNADSITIARLKIKGDTISETDRKKLNTYESTLVNYIVTTPGYYQTNVPVYGLFFPQIEVSYKHKEEAISMRYDLSLKKWYAYNNSGSELCGFDISDSSMLRFSSIIFPNDTLLETLLTLPSK
ncbi:MAG: hypothetical protein HDS96_00330 [Bacteroidales bacterium]|nr:hypothetical protein [Bacteroidales bacterium]